MFETEADYYWLGFIYADGNLQASPRWCIRVVLQERDAPHLEKLARHFGIDHPLKYYEKTKAVGISLYRRRTVEPFLRMGIIPNKTIHGAPPKIPPNMASHFWRGVFDGDGCINHSKRNNTWVCALVGSLATIQGFSDFVGLPRKVIAHSTNSVLISYAGVAPPQTVCRALAYDACSVALDRKRDLALQVLSRERKNRDWGRYDPKDIEAAFHRLGSWSAAAREFGFDPANFVLLRRRLGLLP